MTIAGKVQFFSLMYHNEDKNEKKSGVSSLIHLKTTKTQIVQETYCQLE